MWALFALSAAVHAGGLAQVEYVPAGRADQAWNDSGQQSGTLVAESDGVLVPPLRTSLGWVTGQWGVAGGLSIARVASVAFTSESESSTVRTGVRPRIEARRWFSVPKPGSPLFFIHTGAHTVIPAVSSVEDAASDDESETLSDQAQEDAGRIRNVGISVGAGADYRWKNGLGIGMKSSMVYSRSSWSNAKTRTVSSLLRPETALTLSFWF
jgi:hypothetical protein